MIRVLVVDDSETARAVLVRTLESAPDIKVVAQASDGREAVKLARFLKPDLVTMDVRMPNMNGLHATEEIMASCPTPIVIVSASVDAPDLQITFNALRAGALDVIEKPVNVTPESFAEIRDQLVKTIRSMAEIPVVRRKRVRRDTPDPGADRAGIELVAIGASTGGPPLLGRILASLPPEFPCPVVLVQHMTAGFTAGFVRWLQLECRIKVKLAEHGEPLLPGRIYVAPEQRHLRVTETRRVALGDDAPIERFRPSVDALFQSVAGAVGPSAIGVLLTGMGSDGARGLLSMRKAGAWTLAQDSESATVDGMPAAARALQAVDRVVSPEELPSLLMEATRPHVV